MGSYIVATDLKAYFSEKRIIALAEDPEAPVPEPPETLDAMTEATSLTVDAAIRSAESVVNTHLSRMSLPINPVPESLKRASSYLALYFIAKGKPELFDGKNPFQDDYDRETDWLDRVTESELGLGGTSKAVGEDASIMTSADGCGNEMVFGGGGLDAF